MIAEFDVVDFVRQGHAVFPCEGKAPVKGWRWAQEQITDPNSAILHTYADWGWPVPGGLMVVDIDNREAVPQWLWDELGSSEAAGQISPRGLHYVLHISDTTGPAQVHYPWGEVRKFGTYMRLYRPNDLWTARKYPEASARLNGLFHKQKEPQGIAGPEAPARKPGHLTLVATSDITAPAALGNRNNQMTSWLGACANAPGMDEHKLLELAIQHNKEFSPPLDDQELLSIVKSVARYIGRKPHEESFQPPSKPAEGYFLTAEAIQAGDYPKPVMWLDCWGPEQAVMLHGPSGAGKSLFILDRLRRMPQAKTLVIDGELPMSTIKARLGSQPAPHLSWLAKEHLHEWMELDYTGLGHLVVDTKAALYSHKESENSMEHWAPLNKWIRHWADKGLAVSLLHHSAADQAKARGSTNAITAMDSELLITSFEHGGTRYYSVKQNKDRHGLVMPKRWYVVRQTPAGHLVFDEVENPEF